MLRCASSFVIGKMGTAPLFSPLENRGAVPIFPDSRALPAAFLLSRPILATFKTFCEVVMIHLDNCHSRSLAVAQRGDSLLSIDMAV